MTRPGFLEGAGVALALAVTGGVAFALLVPLLAGAFVLKGVVAAAGLGYLLFLCVCARVRNGRVVALAAWALATAATWALAPSLLLHLAAQACVLWLIRVLLLGRGFVAALADLGLVALGLVAAGWALERTGSVGAAIWSFFLAVALAVRAAPRAATRRAGRRRRPRPFPTGAPRRRGRAARAGRPFLNPIGDSS